MADASRLEAALAYAKRGWSVLPVWEPNGTGGCACGRSDCPSPGKHPRTAHGVKDATCAPEQITKWFTSWPSANIGIATGVVSGIVALDVDPRHGGDESLREIESDLPHTVEALTGGGGRHLLFAAPESGLGSRAQIRPGLDVRGDGGFIVVEPSLHASGQRYAWEVSGHPDEVPLAHVPSVLLDLVGRSSRNGNGSCDGTTVPEGGRNNYLTSVGGAMRRKGTCEESIRAALQAENQRRCEPPLPAPEVDRIARSISRYDPDPREANWTRTRIIVTGRQDKDLLHDARVALAARYPEELFYRDSRLVALVEGDLVAVGKGDLHERLAASADWIRATKEGQQNAAVPRRLVDALMESPAAPIPRVEHVVRIPAFVGKSFTLMNAPGYDEGAQVLYVGEPLDLGSVPDEPDPGDISEAQEELESWLEEFDFTDDTARAHGLALLITLLCRPAIPGCPPMFLIEAATPGTGKTLLAEVMCLAAHGTLPVSTQYTRDGEEMGKRIASWVIAARPVAFLDNLSRISGDTSHVLSSLITTGSVEVRAMRELRAAGGKWEGVIMATGNNVALSDEMPRRICRIRLNSPENPAQRTFKREDLHGWTLEHRGKLVRAVAVLVAAWKAVACPEGQNTRHSFIKWSRAVGGILGCLGGGLAEAFLSAEDLADLMAFDDGNEDFREFMRAGIAASEGGRTFSTSDLVKLAQQKDVLGGIVGDGSDRSRSTRMGNYLKKYRDRVVDGHRFHGRRDPTTKALRWAFIPEGSK